MIQGFELIDEFHVKCIYCNTELETGIVNLATHWLNCIENKEGLINVKDEKSKKILDKLSFNVEK